MLEKRTYIQQLVKWQIIEKLLTRKMRCYKQEGCTKYTERHGKRTLTENK